MAFGRGKGKDIYVRLSVEDAAKAREALRRFGSEGKVAFDKIERATKRPTAAQLAAIESLKDLDCLMGRVRTIIAERERLFARLKDFNWLKPYPSWANFILTGVLRGGAGELHRRLEVAGFGELEAHRIIRIVKEILREKGMA